jgi:hypothetical protein
MGHVAWRRVLASALLVLVLTAGGACALALKPGEKRPRLALSRVAWHRVFFDSFSRGVQTRRWGRYSGQPGGDPGGWWAPSHVVARRGIVSLETYRDPRFGGRWVSGGISSAPALKQTYGKYEIRLRMDRGKGVAVVALLWPVADHWPPEIDFAENGGETNARRQVTGTLHYGSHDAQIQRSVNADFTHWHTLGVEWLPGELVYTLDGRAWARIKGPEVPSEPMELDIQTQAGTCGEPSAPCPDAATPRRVNAQVDWVAAYAYPSRSR